MKFSVLREVVKGDLLHFREDVPITSLITDSRKHGRISGSVFFAMKGQAHDGHDFIESLFQKGCRNYVVEGHFPDHLMSECNVIRVPNSLIAIQQVGRYARQRFKGKVIGVTGSNGKTVVKEWLFGMMQELTPCSKSPMSYNSQLGVPLSAWAIQPGHTFAILEAGISKPGEMSVLADIIRPEIGIFTNIGQAHQEGFASLQEKIAEKAILFRNTEIVICRSDHRDIIEELGRNRIPMFTWGETNSPDIRLQKISTVHGSSVVEMEYRGERHSLELHVQTDALLEDAMHAIALMIYLEFDLEDIKSLCRGLSPIAHRLRVAEGINQCIIVDDTYNNDLTGIESALQQLQLQPPQNANLAILSDSLQSGMEGEQLYKRISDYCNEQSVRKVIGIGPEISSHSHLFPEGSEFYSTTDEMLSTFDFDSLSRCNVLIKGARPFRLERVVRILERKGHGTILEINLGQVTRNLNYFRTKLNGEVKIMAMIKALAYGSGSVEMASHLAHNGVDYLGVAYVDEGINLRRKGIDLPIMVMNPPPDVFSLLEKYKLEPEVHSMDQISRLAMHLRGRTMGIHLKIETGMNRLGFGKEEIDALLSILKQNPNLELKSIFSHLAASDDPKEDEFSKVQADTLLGTVSRLLKELDSKPLIHLLNSSGISRFPGYQYDMVRLGIGLHGFSGNMEDEVHLHPTETLKTFVAQVKELKVGDTIGYSRSARAEKEMKIATLGIGYADGFSRSFSNGRGKVLIKGNLVPVVGNVCMDMTMVDVTGLSVEEGDEVIIFGENPTVRTLARDLNTIPYEILAGVSNRVKRQYVYN